MCGGTAGRRAGTFCSWTGTWRGGSSRRCGSGRRRGRSCSGSDGRGHMAEMMGAWGVRRLHALDDRAVGQLADVLIDCVEGGASVSFMLPLTRERAVGFWRKVAEDATAGRRV